MARPKSTPEATPETDTPESPDVFAALDVIADASVKFGRPVKPLHPTLAALGKRIAESSEPVYVSTVGLDPAHVRLMKKQLRNHAARLFPGKTLRITDGQVNDKPAVRFTLADAKDTAE